MQHWLLEMNEFSEQELSQWIVIVNDIRTNWRFVTGTERTPKVHMLGHSIQFINQFRFLGQLSEAQLESYHMLFNALYHHHHHNCGDEFREKLRRCLADTALHALQAYLKKHGLDIPPEVLDEDKEEDEQEEDDESDCGSGIESSDDEPSLQDDM